MQCPRCRLINPETAQRCDCGYDFASGKVKVPYGIGLTDKSDSEEPGYWTPFGIWPPRLIFGIWTFKEIRSWWKRYFSRAWRLANDRGCEALNQGRYAEAEDSLLTALEEAKNFEPQDPRLGISLDNLANVYNAQGEYAEGERLYQRALAIVEKPLRPEHLDVAVILNNLGRVNTN